MSLIISLSECYLVTDDAPVAGRAGAVEHTDAVDTRASRAWRADARIGVGLATWARVAGTHASVAAYLQEGTSRSPDGPTR